MTPEELSVSSLSSASDAAIRVQRALRARRQQIANTRQGPGAEMQDETDEDRARSPTTIATPLNGVAQAGAVMTSMKSDLQAALLHRPELQQLPGFLPQHTQHTLPNGPLTTMGMGAHAAPPRRSYPIANRPRGALLLAATSGRARASG